MGWKRIVFAFLNLELIKIFLNPVNIKRILEIVHYYENANFSEIYIGVFLLYEYIYNFLFQDIKLCTIIEYKKNNLEEKNKVI